MAPHPGPIPTRAEEQRLLEAFAQAAEEYHRMHAAQVEAILNDQNFPFEEWVAKAAERMDQTKYAILAYREEHR